MSLTDAINKIKQSLRDEESRVILCRLTARYIDGGAGHVWDMLRELHEFDKRKPLPEGKRPSFFNAPRGNAVFYGAGGNAPSIRAFAETIGITAAVYCDSNPAKWGAELEGVRIISPAELLESFTDYPVIVSSPIYEDEITEKLIQSGVKPDKIYSSTFSEKQYFGLPFLRPVKGEIFIDCGAYDGQGVTDFAKYCGGAYKKIYALEPDADNCRRTMSRVNAHGLQNVTLIEKGAWSCEGLLQFSSAGSGSRLSDGGEVELPVTTIDSVVGGEAVTLIKMDIEGAELAALHGAEQTIRRQKPRLAVCLYHKPEDIYEIPEYLLSVNPGYSLYLRHHTLSTHETVLYAVMEGNHV